MMRYFIGFILTIGLIIVLIVLLFSGGGGKSKTPSTAQSLNSYANTDAEVRLTIDGPINAAQTHEQVRITVDRSQATFEQIQGYDNSVVTNQTYASSQNAYTNFLHALTLAGFTTKANTDPKLADERGYCPLGSRYIFELTQDGNDLERYWATNCGHPKTYPGNVNLTLALFKAQVPDLDSLTQNLNFSLN